METDLDALELLPGGEEPELGAAMCSNWSCTWISGTGTIC
ncbi:ALQxL family class IV lanthipeptide [Solihabitans fulvus]|nr:ALQxL family class IV lanthipeptide [Solihabitans fulvus]